MITPNYGDYIGSPGIPATFLEISDEAYSISAKFGKIEAKFKVTFCNDLRNVIEHLLNVAKYRER